MKLKFFKRKVKLKPYPKIGCQIGWGGTEKEVKNALEATKRT